jgi:hypothetical protein
MSREAIEVGAFTWSRIQRLYEPDATARWQYLPSSSTNKPTTKTLRRSCAASTGAEMGRLQPSTWLTESPCRFRGGELEALRLASGF